MIEGSRSSSPDIDITAGSKATHPPVQRWVYILAFSSGLLAVAALLIFHIGSMYRQEMDHWMARQSNVADDRVLFITDWLRERARDASRTASSASVRAMLGKHIHSRQLSTGPRAPKGIQTGLEDVILPDGCIGLYVADASGNDVAHADSSAPLSPEVADASKAVAIGGESRIQVFGRVQDSHLIAFIMPVWPASPGQDTASRLPMGTVIEVLSLSKTLFPILRSEAVPSKTSETRLVRLDGNEVVLFSPSRFRPAGWPDSRESLATAPDTALKAVEGRDGFGEYTDYRNITVLAATRRIPLTGWGLIRKTDRTEALERFHREATLEGMLGALAVVLLGGGLFAFHRQQVYTRMLEVEKDRVRSLNEELEQRVQRRTAELQAANRELEAFTYSVSHDLRAPLRAINGFSEMLRQECGSQIPPEALRHLNLVRGNAVEMSRLIDDLLALSRLGRQQLRRKPVDPAEIAQQSIEALRADWEGRSIEFSVGELPACLADPGLLKQVFVNLLSNAIKFTRKQEKARIEVGSVNFVELQRRYRDNDSPRMSGGLPDANDHVYYVRDNGVGFDMRYADKLFGVFQRLHRQEDFEGTGVGLANVQRIVLKHGGRVWAESEIDKGATFYFTIGHDETGTLPASSPVAKESMIADERSLHEAEPVEIAGSTATKTVREVGNSIFGRE